MSTFDLPENAEGLVATGESLRFSPQQSQFLSISRVTRRTRWRCRLPILYIKPPATRLAAIALSIPALPASRFVLLSLSSEEEARDLQKQERPTNALGSICHDACTMLSGYHKLPQVLGLKWSLSQDSRQIYQEAASIPYSENERRFVSGATVKSFLREALLSAQAACISPMLLLFSSNI